MDLFISNRSGKTENRDLYHWQLPLLQTNVKPGLTSDDVVNSSSNTARNVTILFWNTFNDRDPAEHGTGQAPFIKFHCPVRNCLLTRDRAAQTIADAVLFATPMHPDTPLPDQDTRPAHQKYIYLTHESQLKFGLPLYPPWVRAMFNVTMTFTLDSDIPHPYGVVARKDEDNAVGQSENVTLVAIAETIILVPYFSQVTANHLKIGHLKIWSG